MGKSILSMRARSLKTTPSLIERMSFRLAIPGRVALLQSPPPLHQPTAIVQDNAFAVQSNSSQRRAVS
jgi:hypothetical protein